MKTAGSKAIPPNATITRKTLGDIDISSLKGVGQQLALKLAKLDISSLQDLLFHLPSRYSDRTRVTAIAHLQQQQLCVIEGEVSSSTIMFGKRRSLACRLEDASGSILLRFYHFSAAQKRQLEGAKKVRCYGEVRRGVTGLELYHPEYIIEQANKPLPPLENRLTPVYATTDGIGQPTWRKLIDQALSRLDSTLLPTLLPNDYRPNGADLPLDKVIAFLHRPPASASTELMLSGEHHYQQQLVIEELVAYQLSLLRLREKRRALTAPTLNSPTFTDLTDTFKKSLGFELTGAQQTVCNILYSDLASPIPMMRLIQGDVGSGKTVVAAIAALQAIASGQQTVLMAPTEILAEQHRRSFEQWFGPLGINVSLMTGKQKVAARRAASEAIESGSSAMVIGTHALFQENTQFHKLGLVIIDEQHRFGVHQRLQLRDKAQQLTPHLLIMTATPIPRTLAMSAYADLDYSVIDELPKGRQPVTTVLIGHKRRDQVIERISHACREGRQAYWVCTLIEQSETLSAEAAEDTWEHLKQQLPQLTVGLIHGRLKGPEKVAIMAEFKAGTIDLLVATTVIEVGVDVANASLMVIENPERLGLAQLHQLRGRVGRGLDASHCVMLYGDPLSMTARSRLQAMRETADGFKIAEIDLQLRGPGEVLGTRQTGDISFKLADLKRDLEKLAEAKQLAQHIMQDHPQLIESLIKRWLGSSETYAQA